MSPIDPRDLCACSECGMIGQHKMQCGTGGRTQPVFTATREGATMPVMTLDDALHWVEANCSAEAVSRLRSRAAMKTLVEAVSQLRRELIEARAAKDRMQDRALLAEHQLVELRQEIEDAGCAPETRSVA